MKHSLLVLFGSALLCGPMAATAQQYGDFTYTTNAGAVTITGYTGSGGPVTIPSTMNGLPVVSIGVRAFFGFSSVTSLAIPSGVTNIGDLAFGWTGMTNITIPGSVSGIGATVFFICSNLTAITVDAQNPFYSSVGGVLFDKSQTTLVEYPDGLTGSYTIPTGVTTLEKRSFVACQLSSVTIASSVTRIGASAFQNCYGLTNATIAGSLTNLGDYAFADCPFLRCVFFMGNAPPHISLSQFAFNGVQEGSIWFLPGSTGWPPAFGGSWDPFVQAAGVQGSEFTLEISTTGYIPVLVEASTNLTTGAWIPLGASFPAPNLYQFRDPDWTLYPARFYRIRPF